MNPKAINARKRSRRLAMQALYQLQISGDEPLDIEKQFKTQDEYKSADPEYFHELLFGIAKSIEELMASLAPFLDRKSEEVDPVEKSILLIGVYELKSRLDIPYRAILNEAINLAKKFGAEDGHKYINGILDKAAKAIRQQEIQAG